MYLFYKIDTREDERQKIQYLNLNHQIRILSILLLIRWLNSNPLVR